MALFIDDFKDGIGNSEESDKNFVEGSNWEALVVNRADPSDSATVSQTSPAGTMRTGLATITSATVGSGAVGVFTTYESGGLGKLSVTINDGDTSNFSDFSFGYDYTPVFDATAGGMLDTVEINVEITDWGATKGDFSVEFVEAVSGDIATWSFIPSIQQKESALLSSLPGAGSVDFSSISEINFRLEGGNDLDVVLSGFGLSGPPVPEPSIRDARSSWKRPSLRASSPLVETGNSFSQTADSFRSPPFVVSGLAVDERRLQRRLFRVNSTIPVVLSALWLSLVTVLGHHDPVSDTATITAEIQRKGETAGLLRKRAQLWRALRKPDLAIQDYLAAVTLEPKSVSTRLKLAQTYNGKNALKAAFQVTEEAMAMAPQSGEKASLLMLRASIYLVWKSYTKSSAEAEAAFAAVPQHGRIEWYLQRSYAQQMAGQFEACVKGLHEGYASTGSAVLYAQWVDTLIDAKAPGEALIEIEKQLEGLRYSASWRIRKALALRGLGRENEADDELKVALIELGSRIRPDAKYPDITLLIDRGLAQLLMGNRKAARLDYDRAKAAGALGWMHWRLTKAFGA